MPLSPSRVAPRPHHIPTLRGRYLLFAVHGRTYAVEASCVKQVRRGEGALAGELLFLGAHEQIFATAKRTQRAPPESSMRIIGFSI